MSSSSTSNIDPPSSVGDPSPGSPSTGDPDSSPGDTESSGGGPQSSSSRSSSGSRSSSSSRGSSSGGTPPVVVIEVGHVDYWEYAGQFAPTPIPWIAQDKYYLNDLVVTDAGAGDGVNDKIYKCITNPSHAPTVASKPGAGADWNDFWVPHLGFYEVGDMVSNVTKNYRCIVRHTPGKANRPGDGTADWGSYWELETAATGNFHVDSGKSYGAFTGTQAGGLGHLKGKTVQILANGYVLPSRTVSESGTISFNQTGDPTSFTSLVVGLPYESILEPMGLEAGMDNGTSVTREKRIHEVVIYFHESGGCKVSSRKTGPFEPLPFRTADMIADHAAPLFTGPYVHALESRHDMEASFVMKQDLPLPMTILAVVPKWNIYGDQG